MAQSPYGEKMEAPTPRIGCKVVDGVVWIFDANAVSRLRQLGNYGNLVLSHGRERTGGANFQRQLVAMCIDPTVSTVDDACFVQQQKNAHGMN